MQHNHRVLFFAVGQVSDPEKGVLGTGAHTDYGMMTMLATVSTEFACKCKGLEHSSSYGETPRRLGVLREYKDVGGDAIEGACETMWTLFLRFSLLMGSGFVSCRGASVRLSTLWKPPEKKLKHQLAP